MANEIEAAARFARLVGYFVESIILLLHIVPVYSRQLINRHSGTLI